MKQHYRNLYALNCDLLNEYKKRENNHRELVARLKEVNQVIQKAAKLRGTSFGPVLSLCDRCAVGSASSRVVTECRKALKEDNCNALLKVIAVGSAM